MTKEAFFFLWFGEKGGGKRGVWGGGGGGEVRAREGERGRAGMHASGRVRGWVVCVGGWCGVVWHEGQTPHRVSDFPAGAGTAYVSRGSRPPHLPVTTGNLPHALFFPGGRAV